MKKYLRALVALAFVGAFAVGLPAHAADAKKPEPKDLVLKGDAKCTACHDEEDSPSQLAIGKTRHGVGADKRTPTCTSCHGDSPTHITKPEGASARPGVDVGYTKRSKVAIEDRNAKCLTCHQGGKRIHWQTGTHAARDVACADCHKIHTSHDPIKDKVKQSEVCFNCHKEQRTEINKQSSHPVKEGKVSCSDCHNPHGSAGPRLMKRDSVVETCYTCHMEKRGPFVRSHQPVTEDCSICHNPHGSNVDNLLKQRAPFLCQECHEPSSHRGNPANLAATSTGAGAIARGCLNCHTNIHGSNNPLNTTNERTFRR